MKTRHFAFPISWHLRKENKQKWNDMKAAYSGEFVVVGGVFTDTSFKTVLMDTAEFYGPFSSYEEAKEQWWKGTCKNVDICEHRLFILGTKQCAN